MIDALLHAAGWTWERLLEILWRADHGGRSLERQEPPIPSAWPKPGYVFLAVLVLSIYMTVVLKLGGMEL